MDCLGLNCPPEIRWYTSVDGRVKSTMMVRLPLASGHAKRNLVEECFIPSPYTLSLLLRVLTDSRSVHQMPSPSSCLQSVLLLFQL